MKRLIFNILTILSLLLCLFLTYSCLRSFFPAQLRFESIDGSLMIIWWEGEIPAEAQFDPYNPTSEKFLGTRHLVKTIPPSSDRQCLGFRSITVGGIFRGQTYHIIGIPY